MVTIFKSRIALLGRERMEGERGCRDGGKGEIVILWQWRQEMSLALGLQGEAMEGRD